MKKIFNLVILFLISILFTSCKIEDTYIDYEYKCFGSLIREDYRNPNNQYLNVYYEHNSVHYLILKENVNKYKCMPEFQIFGDILKVRVFNKKTNSKNKELISTLLNYSDNNDYSYIRAEVVKLSEECIIRNEQGLIIDLTIESINDCIILDKTYENWCSIKDYTGDKIYASYCKDNKEYAYGLYAFNPLN